MPTLETIFLLLWKCITYSCMGFHYNQQHKHQCRMGQHCGLWRQKEHTKVYRDYMCQHFVRVENWEFLQVPDKLIKVVLVTGFSSPSLGQKIITLECQKSILRSTVYPIALFHTSFTFLKNLTANARTRLYIRQSIRTLQLCCLNDSDFCTWSCQSRRISSDIANDFCQMKDISEMLFMPEIPIRHLW